VIDLRSDTVTRPTAAMRRAMADAEVGDDVYGDDPSARRLEAQAAEVLGKEAALFVPSGTMANQLALLVHCERGDEVIVGEGAHVYYYEAGAGAALAGVQFVPVGRGGLFDADAMAAAIKPRHFVLPRTRLVCLENTHNRAGGRVWSQGDVEVIAARARVHGLAVHLDGARIWNAAVASGCSPAALAEPADTVSACFSKGLGAPVGSVLAGPRGAVERARRFRRMLGGAMRQVGVLCAAASYALAHHRERLAEDHGNARRLAEGLARVPGVVCDPQATQTNIVVAELVRGAAEPMVARLAEAGVLVNATGPRTLRAVAHMDVSAADVDRALAVFAEVVGG
jgi:threonine aldolase